MRRYGLSVGLLMLCSSQDLMADDAISGLELSKINGVLAALNCRVKPETITKEGADFVLTDVFCADGQFDIRLDAQFELLTKRRSKA